MSCRHLPSQPALERGSLCVCMCMRTSVCPCVCAHMCLVQLEDLPVSEGVQLSWASF